MGTRLVSHKVTAQKLLVLYDASYIEWSRGPRPPTSTGREHIGR
jgi:3-mercaptopyruvate sulfurtransferase SseA